jgi:hypothetical protein
MSFFFPSLSSSYSFFRVPHNSINFIGPIKSVASNPRTNSHHPAIPSQSAIQVSQSVNSIDNFRARHPNQWIIQLQKYQDNIPYSLVPNLPSSQGRPLNIWDAFLFFLSAFGATFLLLLGFLDFYKGNSVIFQHTFFPSAILITDTYNKGELDMLCSVVIIFLSLLAFSKDAFQRSAISTKSCTC